MQRQNLIDLEPSDMPLFQGCYSLHRIASLYSKRLLHHERAGMRRDAYID
ncbi:MAG: hypothetical protein ABJO30_08060 [Hyphomicrobiales bacterium]